MTATPLAKTTASIAAEDTYTDGIELVGRANLSISGSWEATVNLQRSFDGGSTYHNITDTASAVYAWTANTEISLEIGYEEGVLYRAGVASGAYTSGPVVVRLSQA